LKSVILGFGIGLRGVALSKHPVAGWVSYSFVSLLDSRVHRSREGHIISRGAHGSCVTAAFRYLQTCMTHDLRIRTAGPGRKGSFALRLEAVGRLYHYIQEDSRT